MNCKCGNEMLIIKKDFAWYWCGKCGRFLNGGQLFDPGDEWLEPVVCQCRKTGENHDNRTFRLVK